MNLVSWNSVIQIKKRVPVQSGRKQDRLWTEIARPRDYKHLVGNEKAIRTIEDWFRSASDDTEASSCMFVHGKSGTGKSTTVAMVAKKFNFEAVTTYADRSRTPARLEGVVREACVHGHRGVVVLDDFEIFLSETTSLRVLSKLLRKLVSASRKTSRCMFVIISNSKHKLFGPLQDISTVVRFEPLLPREINKIFNRLATRVEEYAYVPPMASFFSSLSTSGTITQGIQQLQLLYTGNTLKDFVNKPRCKKRRLSAQNRDQSIPQPQAGSDGRNNRDCISYLWSGTYTDKLLMHLIDDDFKTGLVIDRLLGFEKTRLDIVGGQLHREYARRVTSIQQLLNVAESISLSDVNRMEIHEDGLYDGENTGFWSALDISFLSFVACGVVAIKGQKNRDQSWSRNSHTRLARYTPLVF